LNTNKRRKGLSLREGLLKSKMKTIWIDGKRMAEEITQGLIKRINQLSRVPELDVIWIGDNPASAIYVRHKQKKAEQLGMRVRVHHLPEDIHQNELHNFIETLNQDNNVDGIMVQMPLPRHLDSDEVLDMVSPDKDVDGLTTVNLGRLVWGGAKLVACTPQACMHLIESVVPDLSGKTAVVVGRSRLVGKPLFHLLLSKNCTVTQAHTKTENLSQLCRTADILVVATGQPGLIGLDDIKVGAVVIDVGISRQSDGSICGDVRSDEVEGIAYAATPVPGGVGPMTVAMLMENTVRAAEMHQGIE
jgi:methylenetetrahydrofolate dehydrogenase (NADP+)/methenyltetrahydrofolate cyclohydrolase